MKEACSITIGVVEILGVADNSFLEMFFDNRSCVDETVRRDNEKNITEINSIAVKYFLFTLSIFPFLRIWIPFAQTYYINIFSRPLILQEI